MRRDQLSADRHGYLVPTAERPNVFALVAPPTPRRLPDGERHSQAILEAHEALGRLQGAMASIPNADMVTRTLARREAVTSSQIESTHSTLSQLLTYEATHGERGLPPDVKVTERYVIALQHGLETIRALGRNALSLSLIHELHAILMQGDEDKFPVGEYRRDQVHIGSSIRIEDATFVPAPPAKIAACMEEFEASILKYEQRADEQYILTAVPQLAIAHAQFETIHPYHDGNGRTGRLLMPLILAADGYPPLYLSGELLRAKAAYYDALARVQLRGEWGPWITMLCRAIVVACRDSEEIARDLVAQVRQWEEQLKGKYRSDSATAKLPKLLLGHPVLSVAQASELLGVSKPAANAALNNLEREGILSLPDERRWGRVFHATTILGRLDQPPASPAPRLRPTP